MVIGILAIIESEFGDAQLEEAPERLAQIGDQAHQVQMRLVCRPRLAKIQAQQQLALLLIEGLINGKVAQIKEKIAHARVLPIDETDRATIINEIAGKQIVMAGADLLKRSKCLFDLCHQLEDQGQSSGKRDAVFE